MPFICWKSSIYNNGSKANPLDAVFLAALGLVGIGTGLWAQRYHLDDISVTFRGRNLAHGRGFVYNLGETGSGDNHAALYLILVPGVWLFGSAPRAALVLNIILSGLIAALAYDVGRRLRQTHATRIGGALLLTLAPLPSYRL